jgi:hypothetical protein
MNTQLLSIRSRRATVTQAATISVAQIELAASQKRQALAKLDPNETADFLRIRVLAAPAEPPLKYRLTRIVVLLVLNEFAYSRRVSRKSSSGVRNQKPLETSEVLELLEFLARGS